MKKLQIFGQQALRIASAVVSLAILGRGWVNVGIFGYVILFLAMIAIVDLCLIFFDREKDNTLVFFGSFGEALCQFMFSSATLILAMFVGQYIYLCIVSTAEMDALKFAMCYWFATGILCLLQKNFSRKDVANKDLFLA